MLTLRILNFVFKIAGLPANVKYFLYFLKKLIEKSYFITFPIIFLPHARGLFSVLIEDS